MLATVAPKLGWICDPHSHDLKMVASNKLHNKESTNLSTVNMGAHWDMGETTTHNKERMNSF